jgi:hypothetical protein
LGSVTSPGWRRTASHQAGDQPLGARQQAVDEREVVGEVLHHRQGFVGSRERPDHDSIEAQRDGERLSEVVVGVDEKEGHHEKN